MDKLDAINCLARYRIGLLVQLRQEPQPHQRSTTADAARNKAVSIADVLLSSRVGYAMFRFLRRYSGSTAAHSKLREKKRILVRELFDSLVQGSANSMS